MINWIHRNIIVSHNHAELARMLCSSIAGAAGDDMFLTPLARVDSANIAYYISTGLIDEKFAAILPLDEIIDGELIRAKQPDYDSINSIMQTLTSETIEMGLIEELLDSAIITESDVHETLTSLNLQLYSEPNEDLPS